jgi:hypothetical protein
VGEQLDLLGGAPTRPPLVPDDAVQLEGVWRWATLSDCGRYRYGLGRAWGPGGRVLFVMLNPSTAAHTADDPTLRRCLGFARAWEFGSLEVVNLFALRATDPRALLDAADPAGMENDRHLAMALARASLVVAAWGANVSKPTLRARRDVVVNALYVLGAKPHALRVLPSGEPEHPLYLPKHLRPVPWSPLAPAPG